MQTPSSLWFVLGMCSKNIQLSKLAHHAAQSSEDVKSSVFFGRVLLTGSEFSKVNCPPCFCATLISFESENIKRVRVEHCFQKRGDNLKHNFLFWHTLLFSRVWVQNHIWKKPAAPIFLYISQFAFLFILVYSCFPQLFFKPVSIIVTSYHFISWRWPD